MVSYIKSDLEFILDTDQDRRGTCAGRASARCWPAAWRSRCPPTTSPWACERSTAPTTTCSRPGSGAPPTASSRPCWIPAYRPADGTLVDPDGPAAASGHADRRQQQSRAQSRVAGLRFEPAHDFQPARRPDAGQSGSHPHRAASAPGSWPAQQWPIFCRDRQLLSLQAGFQRGLTRRAWSCRTPRRQRIRLATAILGLARTQRQASHRCMDCRNALTRRHWMQRATCATALLEPSASTWTATTSSTNRRTGRRLSAPFNSWFTLFGQFFDHGLDLVNKGGNGTVFIPLSRTIRCMSWAARPTSWC